MGLTVALYGVTGAILWGLVIVLLDFVWQWARYSQVLKHKRIEKATSLSFGFVIRLLSVIFLLKIGQGWLSPENFRICTLVVLSLPAWNLLGALLLKRKGSC